MRFGLGPMELLIVGVIAVLLFGNRLPSVMNSLAQGMGRPLDDNDLPSMRVALLLALIGVFGALVAVLLLPRPWK